MIKAVVFDITGVLLSSGFSSKEEVVAENIELAKKLKGKYKLGVLSSASLLQARKIEEVDKIFDVVVLSGEVGFSKPQKEAYEIVLSELGVLPEEVVFIDDLLENIVGAEKLGIKGVLYKSPSQLKESLRGLGIET